MGIVSYLLDTNTISELARPQPDQTVSRFLARYWGNVAISAISWHEMLFSYHRMPASQRKNALGEYLFETVQPEIPILDYTPDAAAWFASERARLVTLGKPPAFVDGQIAATAVTRDLTLVTRNVKDFVNYDGLTLENWFNA